MKNRIRKLFAAAVPTVVGIALVTAAYAANEVSWSSSLSWSLNGTTISSAGSGTSNSTTTNGNYQTVTISGTTDTVVRVTGLTSNGFLCVRNLTPSTGATNLVQCGGSVSNWPFGASRQEAAGGRFIPDGTMAIHCACTANVSVATGFLWTPGN